MKNRKLFIGIVAVAAVVCLNLRHAWRNYGIAENRIMAGAMAKVMADKSTPVPDSTCATKPAPQITVQDKKQTEDTLEKPCPIATRLIYFEENSGLTIATVITDLVTGKSDVQYAGKECPYKEYPCREGTPITALFKSKQITCAKGTVKGSCCYPRESIADCSLLIRGTN